MKRGQAARPVLKWAGGKTQLLGPITRALPPRIRTYFEPFVGGGAVFFAMAAGHRFERAVLGDRNPDLMAVYRALKHDVDAVIEELGKLEHSEEAYYRIREAKPRGLARRAARIIYLNKTGYNGLYRVNRSGRFNVPFGRYKRPNICDEPNLRAVAAVLEDVELEVADFEELCRAARPGDAVYFDPPYVPLSKSANFTAYDRHPFGPAEHERLSRLFGELRERGVPAVLSNSYTVETRALYAGYRRIEVRVKRPINSRADLRGPIRELLVVNERTVARRR